MISKYHKTQIKGTNSLAEESMTFLPSLHDIQYTA